jgi:hypothetical protein
LRFHPFQCTHRFLQLFWESLVGWLVEGPYTPTLFTNGSY